MPHDNHIAILRAFAPYLWQKDHPANNRRIVIALCLLVLEKIIAVAIPLLYGEAIDLLAGGGIVYWLLFISIGSYVFARLLQQIFGELKHLVFTRVAQNAIRTLALQTFQHLHQLSLAFHLNRQTGGLSRVIERGVKSIEFLLTFVLFNIVPTLLEILFVSAIFWWLFDWRYTAIILATILVYGVFTIAVTEWRLRFRKQMNEHDKRAGSYSVDSLLNYETVKYFNAEQFEAQQYEQSLRAYETAAIKSRASLSVLNIGQGIIIAAGMLTILLLAAGSINSGEKTIGLFASVNLYIMQIYIPLNFLGTVYREIRQALTDMDEMFTLLKQSPGIQDAANAKPLVIRNSTVEFDNIAFRYDQRPILNNLSFTVASGQSLAIVGASGSGKSTITRLLYRFYDPNAGRVLIDGQDIRHCTQRSLRKHIGIVPQDTPLFNNSIYNNLRYGNPAASREDIERVIEQVELRAFIASLPDGYETVVGERGLKLSGGEKQRIAIARMLLKNPSIYIFDEATSSLDTKTEKSIQQTLRKIIRGRTVVMIAHRLSTIVDADHIIVLSAGGIAEQGTHATLLAHNGLYHQLWHKQHTTSQ